MSMGVGKSSPPLFRGVGSYLRTAPQELPPLSSILRKTASDSTDDDEDDADDADEAEISSTLPGNSVRSVQIKYKCPNKVKHKPRGRSSKRKGLSSEPVEGRSFQPAKMMRAATGSFSYRRIVPSKYDGGAGLSSPSDTGSDSFSDSPGLSSKRTSKTNYKTATNEENIHAIIELQNFNGSWSSNAETDILEILGIETSGRPDIVDGNIWITLVVVYYLEKNMADEEGTWALVVQKAKDWLSAESASPADMQKGREFLGY
ncbi:hypothetical protein HYALB_00009766 [Hymenoscyphus albidus]|uniref:Uncharacterized protein n=1 Tax=Hymenoscyphus albidus TaxID=595503 RepID=A0A9N9LJR5_9HELO|nr:hypothetical protein HYALB_00009766 [Hymenoscyphus albidus]